MLTFYGGADTVEKQIDHIIGKIFLQFGLTYKKKYIMERNFINFTWEMK